jgi:hypothetical protein
MCGESGSGTLTCVDASERGVSAGSGGPAVTVWSPTGGSRFDLH